MSPNPIACARCNGEVPPERIGFEEGLAKAIAYWRQLHDCFYYLWLDSGEFEDWAKERLSDSTCKVNALGVELASEVSEVRRCYLSWFQDQSADEWAPATACPRCAGPLGIRFEGERPQGGSLLVCEKCSIALLT
jgi:hypothetical protein